MLGLAKWSARRKVVAAATLALLLFLPMGISEQTQPVVTGHSTFYDGQGFDPCLASVAGILRTQVMWFNDQVLAERYGGKGTYVYITENGSADPRTWSPASVKEDPTRPTKNALYSEGTVYDFVDPNGVSWHVDEAFMGPFIGGVQQDGSIMPPQVPADQRTYVWIVELSAFPIHDQFAGDPRSPNYHDLYNFLDIVDTCKFHRTRATSIDGRMNPGNATYNYTITHENTPDNPNELSPGYGHPSGTAPHTHEAFLADIWVGTQPVLIPMGASTKGAEWESNWATNTNNGAASHAQNAPVTYANSTGAGQVVP